MRRKIYQKLLDWKNQWNGRTALLIDGARRIGKSWIAEEFGKNEYKSYVVIDFNNVGKEIPELFENYLTDLDEFYMRLSVYTGIRMYPRETLIIFDEVQMYPRARAAIKYLVKDGRFDFLETGSLVSINHNVKDIVIPSEEIRIDMFPMDLEEFIWAVGEELLYEFVAKCRKAMTPLGDSMHRRMSDLLRTYLIVGGMPQAVMSYATKKDLREVDAIKRTILALYRNDISKYAGKSAPNVTRIFDCIPALLQQHDRRFRPSKVRKGGRMRNFSEPMFWLDESRVINFCFKTTEPSVALALNKVDSRVKLYMADTGLLVSMAFTEGNLEQDKIYEKILRGKLEVNRGMLIENLVAQLLRSSGHDLYYYSTPSGTPGGETMEVDFLIRKDSVTSRHNVIPVEVKSSGRYSTVSLERFRQKFAPYIANPVVLHPGDVEIKDGIVYLPLYMAGML